MEYNLEYYTKYLIDDQNKRFEREAAFLKVLMVNQDSDDAIFNYYNFNSLNEVANFIKYVILPSILLSRSLSKYEEIIQVNVDKKEFLELAKNIDEVSKDSINIYNIFYEKISGFKNIKDILILIDEMNSYYGNEEVFLIMEYSNSLNEYLNDIYLGYKNINENLDELREKFVDTDFELEDLLNLLNDIYSMDQDDLEEFLYQIPII